MYKAFSESKEIKKNYIILRTLSAVKSNYLFFFFINSSQHDDVRGMRSSLLLLRKKIVYEHTR